MKLFLALALVCVSLFFNTSSFAENTNPHYRKNDIRESRFGNDQKQQLIQLAYQFSTIINSQVFGQEGAALALQDKFVQYLENFGRRDAEPIAINLMGLPGIGKSEMLKIFAMLKIQVLTFDAQRYAETGGNRTPSFADELNNQISVNHIDTTKPFVLIVEEIDKLPEIDSATHTEKTQPAIGTLNQIFVNGRFNMMNMQSPYSLSNAFIVTTMNLAPKEISDFSKDALGADKTFYDFSTEDFQKFHEWVLSHPSAAPKLLSHLFRSNTVSRLGPMSILMKPLTDEDYVKVTVKIMNVAIARATQGKSAASRLEVTYSPEFIQYLHSKTTYAPSGARNTVTKADILTDQLINYGKRALGDSPESLMRPRKIFLDYDNAKQSVKLVVTPQKAISGRNLEDEKPFELLVNYSTQSAQFEQPQNIATTVARPPSKKSAEEKEDVITKKEIKASRFPALSDKANGLSDHINETIYGQEKFSYLMEKEMNEYMARPETAMSAPVGLVFAGFPGIGKSEMMRLAAEYLEIPVIKINLQQYASETNDAVVGLMTHITQSVNNLRSKGIKKYILLFEELDKVYEVDVRGMPVNRPVISIVKDIMNNGQASLLSTMNNHLMEIDVRDAFVGITMNFAVDRFGFLADPRLTTIEDVQNAWSRLSTRLSDLKQLLGTMFLPETVNRIISKVNILKPLDADAYRQVIADQSRIVLSDRFVDNNWRDVGQISVTTTKAYDDYLFNEAVVPSEGARFAANIARSLLNSDVEGMTKAIPRSSKFAGKPLTFTLDYDPKTLKVTGTMAVNDDTKEEVPRIYEREVDLNFPPLNISGKIPYGRLITSSHELGHALASIRTNTPFESIVVVPPSNGTGGYVKFRGNPRSADDLIARVYSAMASRAMERITMSSNPEKDDAVVDITMGASSDILQATKLLFNIIKELGFDPNGGVMERMGVEGPSRYANFSDLPHETVEAFGKILKDIENTLVKDFLSLHTKEWYAEKIVALALQGAMTEHQFYELMEMNYPGNDWQRLNSESEMFKLFKDHILEEAPILSHSNYANYREQFLKSIKYNLHPDLVEKQKNPSRALVCANLFE